MILKMRKENQIKSFEITSEQSYINRRSLIKSLGILSATPFFSNTFAENDTPNQKPLDFIKNNQYSTTEPVNSFEDITTYNNYYEFGLDKTDPIDSAQNLSPFLGQSQSLERRRILETLITKILFQPTNLKKEFIDCGVLKLGQWSFLGLAYLWWISSRNSNQPLMPSMLLLKQSTGPMRCLDKEEETLTGPILKG